ncbi:MAG: hypothetical protein NTY66_00700 [Candidatus Vogelbacteria bacterium]|nr:hypothetical protein [Candidatus Vogelbacteria bacterium]
MLTNFGLMFVAFAWLVASVTVDKKKMNLSFIWLYVLGVLLLTVDGLKSGINLPLALNVITLFGAFITVTKIGRKN